MGKKMKPVFPRGVSAYVPGVDTPFEHGHVSHRGLVYDSRDGWRTAKKGEPLGTRVEDNQYVNTNYGYHPGKSESYIYPPTATVESFDSDTHEELDGQDMRHLVGFPPEIGKPISSLLKTMERTMAYDRSSPSAWAGSARAAPHQAAVSHICDGASMSRGDTFVEVMDHMTTFLRDLGEIARVSAKSILQKWATTPRDYVPTHYSTYTLECGHTGAFVAIAYAAEPRYDPASGDVVAPEVMRGGFMVSIFGEEDAEVEITTYMLTPEPVSMRHVDGGSTTYVLHAAAVAVRDMIVDKDATAHAHVRYVHAGQKYNLSLSMTQFGGGPAPRFTAELLLEEPAIDKRS